jgi:hypothetical protein
MDFRMWDVFERLERQGDIWRDIIALKKDLRSTLG